MLRFSYFFSRVFWSVILATLFLTGSSALGIAKEGILVVAFGTSVKEALPALEAIDKDIRQAFPDAAIEWSYTSQIIRNKLAKQGKIIPGISAGLAALKSGGAETVRVIPLHVLAGEEFSALERAVLLDINRHPQRFKAVYLGRPLLDSVQDAKEVAAAVLDETRSCRKEGAALALMAHGQSQGRAGLAMEGARFLFHSLDENVFMASVEGERSFEMLLEELAGHDLRTVCLAPLMVTAGDHARNDLAGEERDSWKSRLQAAGYDVRVHLKGLGEIPGVRAVYVRHARESRDELVREPVKP